MYTIIIKFIFNFISIFTILYLTPCIYILNSFFYTFFLIVSIKFLISSYNQSYKFTSRITIQFLLCNFYFISLLFIVWLTVLFKYFHVVVLFCYIRIILSFNIDSNTHRDETEQSFQIPSPSLPSTHTISSFYSI